MEVQNEATGKVFTIGVRVVTEDNFAHLGAIARNNEGKMYIMRGWIHSQHEWNEDSWQHGGETDERKIHHGARRQGLADEEHGQVSDIWNMRTLRM
jgi:hypothetical protein